MSIHNEVDSNKTIDSSEGKAMARGQQSKYVPWKWVISILVGLVIFFGGMGMRDVVGKVKEHDTRLAQSEQDIAVLKANYANIKEVLDEMKIDLKEIKREVKK